MKLNLIIKANIKTYLYACLVLIFSTIILLFLNLERPTNYFPDNYLYIDNNQDIDIESLDSTIDYCPTKKINYSGDELQTVTAHNPFTLDQQIYYQELDYLPETTVRSQNLNLNETNQGNLTSYINVAYLFDCDLRENVIYDEPGGSIAELVLGVYPTSENEILISENYALKQLQLNEDMTSYEDIIGTEVTINSGTDQNSEFRIKDQTFTVSGIYAGSNDLYLYPTDAQRDAWINQEPGLSQAAFLKFENEEQKNAYIETMPPSTPYLDSSTVNKILPIQIAKYLVIILIAAYVWTLLYLKNRDTLHIVNFHNYNRVTDLLVYTFNTLLVLVFILISTI